MPLDATIGRALADELTKRYLAKIGAVSFTYDAYLEADDMPSPDPFCKIAPQTYVDVRESRANWRIDCELVLTLISPVGSVSAESWIDDWLDSWDKMIREVRTITVSGKYRVLSVDREERYDPDVFHNHQRLLTQATILFRNIEVQ